jgi:hypothetical protein
MCNFLAKTENKNFLYKEDKERVGTVLFRYTSLLLNVGGGILAIVILGFIYSSILILPDTVITCT